MGLASALAMPTANPHHQSRCVPPRKTTVQRALPLAFLASFSSSGRTRCSAHPAVACGFDAGARGAEVAATFIARWALGPAAAVAVAVIWVLLFPLLLPPAP